MSSDAAGNLSLVESLIREFVTAPDRNTLSPTFDEPLFDPPLVGVARGNDPLFNTIQDNIGPFHWLPEQAFAAAFPDEEVSPEELSVISWVLPHTEQTRIEQRRQNQYPGLRWSLVRRDGELLNEALRTYLADELTRRGYPSTAPTRLSQWHKDISPQYGYASTWSERHAAYACGLGTFSINDGLITPRGMAMRTGSVVAKIILPATPRLYTSHTAWCLHYTTGNCLVCAQRCPAQAISPNGHDKQKCLEYIANITAPYVRDHQLGEPVSSCGLCQVGVPCEARVPQQGKTRAS